MKQKKSKIYIWAKKKIINEKCVTEKYIKTRLYWIEVKIGKGVITIFNDEFSLKQARDLTLTWHHIKFMQVYKRMENRLF